MKKMLLLLLTVTLTVVSFAQTGTTVLPQASKKPEPAEKVQQPASSKSSKPASTSTNAMPGQKVEDMMDSFQMMEKEFWAAWKKKDAKPFEQHMAANSLIIDNTGITDKAEALKGIAGCDVKNYDLSNFKLTKIDANNALLTYQADHIDAV